MPDDAALPPRGRSLARRGRDRLGRPVPLDSPDAVPDVPEQALRPEDALALAQALLQQDRAFAAHEVLEASWKAAAPDQREAWQGLAQVCVGVTHLQRGNVVGGVRLLRRGAGRLDGVPGVRGWALTLADQVEAGAVAVGGARSPWRGTGGRLRLPEQL